MILGKSSKKKHRYFTVRLTVRVAAGMVAQLLWGSIGSKNPGVGLNDNSRSRSICIYDSNFNSSTKSFPRTTTGSQHVIFYSLQCHSVTTSAPKMRLQTINNVEDKTLFAMFAFLPTRQSHGGVGRTGPVDPIRPGLSPLSHTCHYFY